MCLILNLTRIQQERISNIASKSKLRFCPGLNLLLAYKSFAAVRILNIYFFSEAENIVPLSELDDKMPSCALAFLIPPFVLLIKTKTIRYIAIMKCE